jgi:hypothetical protein
VLICQIDRSNKLVKLVSSKDTNLLEYQSAIVRNYLLDERVIAVVNSNDGFTAASKTRMVKITLDHSC